ncbi:maleylpyruvate isomerase family mycothiol-dependent enzyme [Streptomyces armeniacus]|uniref:Maleylpyruvate isomerase family mycothiol-dependent enzyme n=2 Tax=Streptomyces armeniacus TaxID=83291 RepID=A0A345XNC1_9ACTN|nr:maleylpyruvate isomerase family mycothiol-dependent enzyme [Streptomyces armeniacus]
METGSGTETGTGARTGAGGDAGTGAHTGAGVEAPDAERLIEGLRVQTARFASAVHGLDPEATVPTCPEWRLRVLVAHIGQAHRWAAELVRTGRPAPVPDPADVDPGEPRGWAAWLHAGAAELAGAVREAPAGATVWTLVGPRPAAFWVRRMLHDTSVHYADALHTARAERDGGAGAGAGTGSRTDLGYEIDADLAADAVSELLELASLPEAVAALPALAALSGDGETLRLRPAEPDMAGWRITRTPAGVRWERGTAADAGADVTVTGPAADLLLLFARRLPPTAPGITITGNRPLLDHWLDHTAL